MIVQHKSLKRSERIIKSLIDKLNKNINGLDGVFETFMNQGEQGYVLKMLYTFDSDSDICIWVNESLKNNMIEVIVGNHKQCDINNYWDSNPKLLNKKYKVVSKIQKDVVSDLFDLIKQHYSMDITFKI
jgi:hypothetical protein